MGLGRLAPFCYLNRPQGDGWANPLPQREQLTAPIRPLASQNEDVFADGQRAGIGQTETEDPADRAVTLWHPACGPWVFSLRSFPFFSTFETFSSKIVGGGEPALSFCPCRAGAPRELAE